MAWQLARQGVRLKSGVFSRVPSPPLCCFATIRRKGENVVVTETRVEGWSGGQNLGVRGSPKVAEI